MAIFGSKKNANTKPNVKTKAVAVATEIRPQSAVSNREVSFSGILERPRITEKASTLAESNAYAFEVATNATKATVAAAIRELYNVEPVKVAILNIPTKTITVKNKKGIKRGGRKAYVFLQKGQTIELT